MFRVIKARPLLWQIRYSGHDCFISMLFDPPLPLYCLCKGELNYLYILMSGDTNVKRMFFVIFMYFFNFKI